MVRHNDPPKTPKTKTKREREREIDLGVNAHQEMHTNQPRPLLRKRLELNQVKSNMTGVLLSDASGVRFERQKAVIWEAETGVKSNV